MNASDSVAGAALGNEQVRPMRKAMSSALKEVKPHSGFWQQHPGYLTGSSVSMEDGSGSFGDKGRQLSLAGRDTLDEKLGEQKNRQV